MTSSSSNPRKDFIRDELEALQEPLKNLIMEEIYHHTIKSCLAQTKELLANIPDEIATDCVLAIVAGLTEYSGTLMNGIVELATLNHPEKKDKLNEQFAEHYADLARMCVKNSANKIKASKDCQAFMSSIMEQHQGKGN